MNVTAMPQGCSWRELPLIDGLDEAAGSYPETRIGAFDFSEATRTDVLGHASGSVHRASIASCREVVADLGFFSQEDPIGFLGGPNHYLYAGGTPIRYRDPLGLYSVEDGAEDSLLFLAGLGDGFLLDLSPHLRAALGTDNIDRCGSAYRWGNRAALLLGLGRLGYAATMKGVSLVARARALKSGADALAIAKEASEFRDAVKLSLRGGLFPNLRKITWEGLLKKTAGDPVKVIESAGRTNPFVNAAGASAAAGGAHAEACGCEKQ